MKKKYLVIFVVFIFAGIAAFFINKPMNDVKTTVPIAKIDTSGTWTTFVSTTTDMKFSLDYPSSILAVSTDNSLSKFASEKQLTHTISFARTASDQYSMLVMVDKIIGDKLADSYLSDTFPEYKLTQFGGYKSGFRQFENGEVDYVLIHNSYIYHVKFHDLTTDTMSRVSNSFHFIDK